MGAQTLGWRSPKKIWIAAGGTAGHLLPAVGVAESLVRSGLSRDQIGFITSSRPIERQVVDPYGFELWQMDTRGLARRVDLRNLIAVVRMIGAIADLFRFSRNNKPDIVVGFGGYFSFPPMFVARVLGIPSIVVETNAVAGLANRIISKIATISLASTASCGIPNANYVEVPLRPEIAAFDPTDEKAQRFRSLYGLPADAFLVSIFGGSLGALKINQAAIALVEKLREKPDLNIAIYHVIGSRDFPLLESEAKLISERRSNIKYIFREFDPEIFKALRQSDLVISRAGSGTVSELSYLGKPSILIPLPNAPGDHQSINAVKLVEANAARIVSDETLSADVLLSFIEELYNDRSELHAMSQNAQKCFKGDGSDMISAYVLGFINKEAK